jgi:hypothetical protein
LKALKKVAGRVEKSWEPAAWSRNLLESDR